MVMNGFSRRESKRSLDAVPTTWTIRLQILRNPISNTQWSLLNPAQDGNRPRRVILLHIFVVVIDKEERFWRADLRLSLVFGLAPLPTQLALAQPGEDDGRHDQDVNQTADHAADDGRSQRFHYLRAGARAPHDGQQTRDDGRDRHDLGTEPQPRAVFDRLDQVVAVEVRAALGLLFPEHLIQINDHDDAGLDGGAEERDVADPNGDTEVVAEQVLQEHAAGQGERDREDHVRRFLGGVIDHIEQKENDKHGRRQDDQNGAAGRQEVFVFAGIFDLHAGRQRGHNHAIDPLFDLLDETAEV